MTPAKELVLTREIQLFIIRKATDPDYKTCTQRHCERCLADGTILCPPEFDAKPLAILDAWVSKRARAYIRKHPEDFTPETTLELLL